MKIYKHQTFTGERALFQAQAYEISYSTFFNGESPLKESKDIKVDHSIFEWKYPFWYAQNIHITNSILNSDARAAIWYTDHITVENTTIEAPKSFRRTKHIHLSHVHFSNAEETLWNCSDITMNQVSAKGEYFAMGSYNMSIEDFSVTGSYTFDGVKNVIVKRAKIVSKDAFWNSEDVLVEDSFISGEYIGWNSKNITFRNCTIESNQGFCYMENVVLENCHLINTDLAFEYSTVNASIHGIVESIKNPISGKIVVDDIKEIIFDNKDVESMHTEIIIKQAYDKQI